MARRENVPISVIMACHNSSEFLAEAVTSVLNQTYSALDLILVDDASTDDTLAIARRFEAKDCRVSVIPLPAKSGPAAARNAGIKAAKGMWLGILDSDDVALPDRFEEQIRLTEGRGDLVMVGANSVSIDATGRAIKTHRYPTTHRSLIRRLERMGALPPHSSLIYKKDSVVRLSAFNPRYQQSEDYDLWLRLSEKGTIASIAKPLVRIRKHTSNMSDLQGGRPQARFGIVAAVCHFLRVNHCPDPSAAKSERTWQQFLSWVDERIIQEGVLERRTAWADARATFLQTQSGFGRFYGFAGRLLRSRQTAALIREKLFGFSLAEQIADQWMTRSPSAVAPECRSAIL